MKLAVDRGHIEIVYYFFKETDMDTSQFDEVIYRFIAVFWSMHILFFDNYYLQVLGGAKIVNVNK